MAKKKPASTRTPSQTLRERAEGLLRKTRTDIASMAPEDVQKLVHELQVHQIELQIQNEELRNTQVELSESRDGYADLYDFAPVGYVTLSDRGKILAANLNAATLLGVDRKNLIGRRLFEFVAADAQETWHKHRYAVFSEDAQQTCELAMHKADGTPMVVRLESLAFGTPANPRCRSALIDNTARRKAEEELQRLNLTLEQRVADQTREVRLLAEAVANLGEGVVITDDEIDWPGPRIRFVNEAMCRITGYSADEMIGKTPRMLQGKESDRATLDRLKSELSAGRSFVGEVVNYRKDGTPYDAEIFITPLFEGSRTRQSFAESNSADQSLATSATERTKGRRTIFISIHLDITARKRAEQTLRESESRLSSVVRTAAEAIITIDQRGLITSFNAAAERMFGYAASEVLGQNVKLLMPPPYCDEHDSYIARFLSTRQPRVIGCGREITGRRKDGSLFLADLSVSEIDHQGFTGILRDLSERRELQQQILEVSADEQRRIGQELHDGTQQELTALQLVAGTLLDLLHAAPEETTAEQSLWRLDKSSYSQLCDISMKLSQRLAEANQHVQQLAHGIMPVQIDADGLRAALEELAASTNGLHGVTCEFTSVGRTTVANNTKATHLYRITQEAVNNALRHGRASHVCIALEQRGNQFLLEVRDNGTGFDLNTASRSAVDHPSAGFGLRIMEYRAGLIGATFRIERGKEGGTVVRCLILRGNHDNATTASPLPAECGQGT